MQINNNFAGQDFNQMNPHAQVYTQQPAGQSYYILQAPVQQQAPGQRQPYKPDQFRQQNAYHNQNNQNRPNMANQGGTLPPNGMSPDYKTTLDLKKTKLCPVIKQGKRCSKGDMCNFAHTIEELRAKPNLSKTKMCP